SFWHRMGDVGYMECIGWASRLPVLKDGNGRPEAYPTTDRFWFCGRKSHRVITPRGTLFTIPCEAIFNQHPWIYRSALVGAGSRGQQIPVVFVEAWPEHRSDARRNVRQLRETLRKLARENAHTTEIEHFILINALPVDIRHNAKIFREELAQIAEDLGPNGLQVTWILKSRSLFRFGR